MLFEDVTWTVSTADRVGLTGPNGAGKTTLFKILSGLDSPDAGEVTMPRGTTVGYLPQEGVVHFGRSLRDEVMTVFSFLLDIASEQRELEEKMAHVDPTSPDYASVLYRYGECQEIWTRHDGFTLESQVEVVLLGLGFKPDELALPTETFSGGWQMRIALAKLLLARPSLLLLDEPTNHLDLEARNWLEAYLLSYPHAVVLVSHDRYFLDQVVTRITEIDRRSLVDYTGNYTRYLDLRSKALEELRARARHLEEERERMERFISRFRYQATKAAQVQSRVKMLDKLETIEVPPERKPMKVRLPPPARSGRVVLELKSLSKRYGAKEVFREAELLVERGEKVAVVGPNGAGKSTLMRLLAEVEPPDRGERKLGHNVSIAYFGQDRSHDLDGEKTVLGELMSVAPMEVVPQLRSLLGAFLFRGDDVEKKVKVLSGGEKSRLALAKMLLRPANLLLMDEPTNHLDLDSKDVLLEALQNYPGTVLVVSHDRYFLDELATRVAEVGGGGIRMYWGNYEDYLRAVAAQNAPPPAPVPTASAAAPVPPPSGKTRAPRPLRNRDAARQVQKERQKIEASIVELETAVASLEGRMAVPGFYGDRDNVRDVVATHQTLKGQLEKLYKEWETLPTQEVAG